ncbi:poly(A) RNA polymerase gld-2B-like [Tropilaelaps mercedesae]|uniref:Poly(A) RNA polymerase gld-2B-like n=1 Tax=Tropilaelaps mercedesae TaxID=418985 RepID=A0A1V9XYS9_9ACAR|nr:poly(A) RNA polymerase gld-2B-like [Tropilaelaps mercedesae]
MFASEEPLDRKREYWTTNLTQMLCHEGVLQKDQKMELVPSTPAQPYCLSQGVIRLIEQEPEIYIPPSFPKGIPGQRNENKRPPAAVTIVSWSILAR